MKVVVSSNEEIRAPFFKAVSAWVVAMLSSLWVSFTMVHWDKLAQFAAFIYTCSLIFEYLYKKFKKKDKCEDGTD